MGNGFFFLTFIGAAIYFIQQASTFWGGVLGFLKAIIWPVLLVYDAFKYLGQGAESCVPKLDQDQDQDQD